MKFASIAAGVGCSLVFQLAGAQVTQQVSDDLQDISQTPPQQAAGRVIGLICPLGVVETDLQNRCDEVVVGASATISGLLSLPLQPDLDGARDGLQAMAAEEDSVAQSSQNDSAGATVDTIAERLGNLRVGAIQSGSTAVALSIDGQPVDPASYAYDENVSGLAAGESMDWGGWSFFVDGSFSTGDKDETRRESGFDMDSFQVTVGLDYQLRSDVILGGAFSYTNLDADVDNNGGQLESDGYGFFGYATWYPNDNFYVDATLGYTTTEIDQERAIRYSIAAVGGGTTNVNKTAFSDTDSDEFIARLALGYDFYNGDWTYGPYGRIEYADVEIDGFRENIPVTGGSGFVGSGLGVEIDDQDFNTVPLVLGLHVTKAIDVSYGTIYPRVFAEYVHEFDNDAEDISGRFLGDPTNTTFFIPTDDPDRNMFNVGASLATDFGEGRSGYLSFQTLLGHKDIDLYVFGAGVRFQF